MDGLNRVMIIGNLGRDVEMRFTANGKATATFSVAATYGESVEWFNVVVWEKLAELCSEHLSKGRRVYVEGRMATRSWDGPDGAKRYRTEVVANQVLFLDRKGSETGPEIDPDDLPFDDD